MKLTELFTSNKQMEDVGRVLPQSTQNAGAVNRQLQTFAPGQTIQGEVVARNGNEVQIKISEDLTIKARVDQNIHLDIGKSITFEVKNNGHTLTLSPLYANTATDANVLKALTMAGLPVNENTVAMTEQLMRAGLSVNKNSLQQIFRECNLFSNASVEDIVDLHKLSLPVNEENVAQIASYKNLSHQLVKGMEVIVNGLPETVQNMLQQGNVEGAARLYQDLLNMISGHVSTEGNQQVQGTAQTVGDLQQLLNQLSAQNGAGPAAEGLVTDLGEGGQEVHGQVAASWDPLTGIKDTLAGNASILGTESEALGNVQEKGMPSELLRGEVVNGNTMGKELQGTTQEQLQQQITRTLGELLQQGIENKDYRSLRNLLGNKNVSTFIKDNLLKQWTIRPQDVADPKAVEQLFQRMDRQLKGLAQTLENAGQQSSQTYQTVNNMSQNLDFMQQLNQTYAYMQLPLRLQQGKSAHGELYVYSNKKHMASHDGQITALLHLDMENLGPLDVYVAMQNQKVNTKFYVQDEVLDFLEAHMDTLTARLKKRGYDCKCDLVNRKQEEEGGEETGAIHRMLGNELQVPLGQYAFDVRT